MSNMIFDFDHEDGDIEAVLTRSPRSFRPS